MLLRACLVRPVIFDRIFLEFQRDSELAVSGGRYFCPFLLFVYILLDEHPRLVYISYGSPHKNASFSGAGRLSLQRISPRYRAVRDHLGGSSTAGFRRRRNEF